MHLPVTHLPPGTPVRGTDSRGADCWCVSDRTLIRPHGNGSGRGDCDPKGRVSVTWLVQQLVRRAAAAENAERRPSRSPVGLYFGSCLHLDRKQPFRPPSSLVPFPGWSKIASKPAPSSPRLNVGAGCIAAERAQTSLPASGFPTSHRSAIRLFTCRSRHGQDRGYRVHVDLGGLFIGHCAATATSAMVAGCNSKPLQILGIACLFAGIGGLDLRCHYALVTFR